jgi:hypothetical protein
MKKSFILVFIILLASQVQAQKAKKIVVKSAVKGCIAALIPHGAGNENGENWWNEWQKLKKAGKTKKTPATFTNIPKGKYTIVIYNPASKSFDPNSSNPNEQSDGVVLEQVEIDGNNSFEAKKDDFKEWNCLSCPWLYVFDGQNYMRQCEIIKDVVGKSAETTTKHQIDSKMLKNNTLKIKIQEEKDEISYLNRLVLKVGKNTYLPSASSSVEALYAKDQNYLQLRKGEFIEIEFKIPQEADLSAEITLEATGYYEPDKEFLKAVYQQYLKK